MKKSFLTRKQQIFDFLNSKQNLASNTKLLHEMNEIMNIGCSAETISETLHLDRSNASRDLHTLFKENMLLKISGKPVTYFSKDLLEKLLNIHISECFFPSKNEFMQMINESKYVFQKSNPITTESKHLQRNQAENIFSGIIGYNTSLKEKIEQAIAAIIYPPNGLHTLLLGSTGTGKTTFAGFMYQYAVASGCLSQNAPYIVFNCADYSGNQQLLLSYLFGYIKGAFTGADKDKTGLIDEANDGILFLDEVHRLPPEGQEMLFSLIDRGSFRRLGETNNLHKANIRLILATTENPDSNMLTTFMRRIPCTISIPDLSARPLEDRLNLIYSFFAEESKKINLPITVSVEVMKLLLLYDCQGNIGQLKNDIKITCAKALVEYITEQQPHVIIKLSQMIKNFLNDKMSTYKNYANSTEFFILNKLTNVTFHPQDFTPNQLFQNFISSPDYQTEEDFYETILKSSKTYFEQGISITDMQKNINLQVENYFHRYTHGNRKKENFPSELALTSIIDVKIIDIVKSILKDTLGDLDTHTHNKVIYSLALHLETLLERIKTGISVGKPKLPYTLNLSDKEYTITQKIKKRLETSFSIDIPQEEAFFITVFLNALKTNTVSEKNFIGVLVVTHGDTTASSMVDVANELLKTKHVKALNMPLSESIQNTVTKAVQLVQQLNTPKGCLLLVDMGSLTSLGDIIEKKTGIKTKTLKMVSTPMVIEAARRSTMPNTSLATLVNEVEISSKLIGNSSTILPEKLEDTSSSSAETDKEYDYFEHDKTKMLKMLESVLTFLDAEKAYTLLNQIYVSFLNKLQLNPEISFKVKFIFHNISMLERVIRNDPLNYRNFENIYQKNLFLAKIIREEFKLLENSFGIFIPNSEISYNIEMINIFIKTQNK